MPVPRPVISSTGLHVRAATIALLGVVLAIPISPVAKRSMESFNENATSMPASMEAMACSRVMAGPVCMLAVPEATRLEMILPSLTSALKSPATPASTTTTCAPAKRASALQPAPPLIKLWIICMVTSCGYWLTPEAATP